MVMTQSYASGEHDELSPDNDDHHASEIGTHAHPRCEREHPRPEDHGRRVLLARTGEQGIDDGALADHRATPSLFSRAEIA
jgi:hypothetical protein